MFADKEEAFDGIAQDTGAGGGVARRSAVQFIWAIPDQKVVLAVLLYCPHAS